jgi:hypothetical protein
MRNFTAFRQRGFDAAFEAYIAGVVFEFAWCTLLPPSAPDREDRQVHELLPEPDACDVSDPDAIGVVHPQMLDPLG